MADVDIKTQETSGPLRDPTSYGSIRGFDTQSLPWRLWDKAKRHFWDPAEIDFSKDAEDWSKLDTQQQFGVAALARGFMVGEEAVTLDILPFVRAVADEGRTEETMFLTSFVFEEAKHVEFFRRWFDAIGFDPKIFDDIYRQAQRQGRIATRLLFSEELPRVMRRLDDDRSPEALLDATLTYNQFVEGVMAIAGYRVWGRIFGDQGILPGLEKGLQLVQRDERRHIAYGTYVPRRIIAENPGLWPLVERRFEELRSIALPDPKTIERAAGDEAQGRMMMGAYNTTLAPFRDYAVALIPRRIEALAVARNMTPEDVVAASGADDEAEEELEAALDPTSA